MLRFFNVMSVANLDISLFSPDCSYPLDYFSKWKVMQLLPLIMGMGLALVYLGASRFRQTPLEAYTVIGALLYLLVTIYTYLISNALEPYNCIAQPDGTYMMAFNPGTLCFEGAWTENQGYFAAAAMVYCGIIPLFLIGSFLYYRNPVSRDTKSFQQLFGILSYPFRSRFFYWEIVHTLEKVAIVSSADIFSTMFSNQSIKVFTVITFIFLFHTLGSVLHPYRVEARNDTESIWSIIRVLFLMSSFVYASDKMSDQDKKVFSLLLMGMFAFFFSYTLGSILLYLRSRKSTESRRLHRDLETAVSSLLPYISKAERAEVTRSLHRLPHHVLKLWVSASIENLPNTDRSVTEKPAMQSVELSSSSEKHTKQTPLLETSH